MSAAAAVQPIAGAPRMVAGARALSARSALSGSSGVAGFHAKAPRAVQARGQLKVTAVFEKFTERAIKAVMLAQQEAKSLARPEVGTEHILLGLIAEEGKKDGYLGTAMNLEAGRVKAAEILPKADQKPRRSSTSEVPFSRGAKKIFEAALEESRQQGMNYIAPEHLAIAIAGLQDDNLDEFFRLMGADRTIVRAEATKRLSGEKERDNTRALQQVQQQQQKQSQPQDEKPTPLQEFCQDLTARAREGKIDPVIGREEEVERVVQILARRSKNNPILLGEPGVGKTAVAESLALRIISGNVPEFLLHKRVMQLDVGLLMAGAKERGELESRVTGLIAEVIEKKDVVLMIDEVHTLVGAGAVGRGSSGGGMDISNLIKPPLARGELQCIGATTVDEHRKYIEKDAALERRFQPVFVDEPSEEEATEILFGLRARYEEHHKCRITDDALRSAVILSSRYVADRFLPDKAIDLMDEAGSRARIEQYMARKQAKGEQVDKVASMEVMELWRALKQVGEAKESAIREMLFEEAGLLRNRESDIKRSLQGLGVSVDEMLAEVQETVVDAADIEEVAAAWTGIPVQKMSKDEMAILGDMDGKLKGRVIGQDDAVEAVARSLRRTRCGLSDQSRPIASFLFAGPTGVGKTELTKSLADEYFGSPDAMIRLDMSEYMERHSVSKLVGAPPGYVGFGQGGTLTEAVRRRPFSIVLFDEIEKAHPDVFNILLQVLEDGRLTDSQGRVVSFKNTLIILTSNVGSQVIAKGGKTLGFQLSDDSELDGGAYARLRGLVLEELRGFFRPELLNRLDEIVVYRQLDEEDVARIASIMLKETAERMQAKEMEMALTPALLSHLLKQGFDQAYGARPLRRAIMSIIDDNLSEAVLTGAVSEGQTAVIDFIPPPEGAPEEDGEVVVRAVPSGSELQVKQTAGVELAFYSKADEVAEKTAMA